jgi:bifunctional DNase/RNase
MTIDGKRMMLDSRPSDAIALALRVDCPIFVNEEVINSSRNTIAAGDMDEGDDESDDDESDDEAPDADDDLFGDDDESEWPDDFDDDVSSDYKM